jgi:hypothetical protein
MKLIIIHGPPAAGKLTVANAIAERTGIKVFHNHLSIDCVKPVIEFGTPAFWRVVGDVRNVIITEAMREGISLIHTFCYEFGADDEYFHKLISAAEENGGEVHLILLTCDDEERKRRIGNESRVKIGKLTDPDAVGRNNIELTSPLPGHETLIIDTTGLSPEVAAEQIVEHYRLT